MATPVKGKKSVLIEERVKPSKILMKLSSLYTVNGLFFATQWLAAGAKFEDCPFENPEQAETIALHLLLARFNLASIEEVKAKIDRILEALFLEGELEANKEFKLDSYVPPSYLLRQWEREARQKRFTRNETQAYIHLQNLAWINQLKNTYSLTKNDELLGRYNREKKETEGLFARREKVIEENLPRLRNEVAAIVNESFPELKQVERSSLEGLILKDLELGLLEARDIDGFSTSLRTSISENLASLGLAAPGDYDRRFSEALGKTYPSKEKVAKSVSGINQINEAIEDIEQTIKTVVPSGLPEEAPRRIPKIKVEKVPEGTPMEEPIVALRLADFQFARWRPIKTKTFPLKDAWSLTKKVALSPIAKPVQWLIDFAPESYRQENLALVYAAKGFTPGKVERTLQYLYKNEPESPEISFWQSLRARFISEGSPFTSFFEHYYGDSPGRVGTRVRALGTSRIARIVTFGRFDNFISLRASFWGVFKSSRVGGFVTKGAAGALKFFSKASKFLGHLGVALASWETFKRVGKAFAGYLGALFVLAAHYGPLAVGGLITGLTAGFIPSVYFAFKAGAFVSSVATPFIGVPVGIVTFFVSEGLFALGGLLGGIGLQAILDKIGASVSATSLPGAAAGGASGVAAKAAATTATQSVGTTLLVLTGSTYLVFQVVSSAFVIPEKGRLSPWEPQSDYFQVEKTVTFKNEVNPTRAIGNNEIDDTTVFTYQFTITDVRAPLTNIRAEDNITTTQASGTNQIENKIWSPGNIPNLNPGETWTSELYDIPTRPVNRFIDAILENRVIVTADVPSEGKTGERSFDSKTVTIGSPPEECPRGWPVDLSEIKITQGPSGSFSHSGQEAIDIDGVGNTTPVKATHKGTAHSGSSPKGGNYVTITSTCEGITFISIYAHLGTVFVQDGKPIKKGETIGITDATGQDITGPHLHYEFQSPANAIKMARPNIPVNVPYGNVCNGANPCIY